MTRPNAAAGAQVGVGPKFWARILDGIYAVINLVAWGPDGSEVVVDDVDGSRFPVQVSPPATDTFTNLGGALSSGTITLPAAPDSRRRWVQNLDVSPLKLTFDGGAFIYLAPTPQRDNPGGAQSFWNDADLTYHGEIVLNSDTADAHYGAGIA